MKTTTTVPPQPLNSRLCLAAACLFLVALVLVLVGMAIVFYQHHTKPKRKFQVCPESSYAVNALEAMTDSYESLSLN